MRVLTGLLLCVVAGAAFAAPVLLDPSLQVDTVVTGLSQPTTMAFLAANDFLVLEKNTGVVKRVLNGVASQVLDVNVNFASERGLLGIAISDDSTDVFLYYTERTGPGDSDTDSNPNLLGNRVYRYTWNSGPGTLTGGTLILDLPVIGGPNHDGGVLALDNESPQRLYAMIGDLNRAGQLQNRATGNADDTSVILRVDRFGAAALGNPLSSYCSHNCAQSCTGSPECGAGNTCITNLGRYYAYGIRNGFGLTIDPDTGAVWNTENGPGDYDEVNRVDPGFNSGWLDFMGPQNNDGDPDPDPRPFPEDGVLCAIPGGSYSDPEFSWLDTNAPTGIVFPSGSALGPAYDPVALVGDSNRSQIYRFPLNGARTGFDFAAFPALQDLVAANNAEADQVLLGTGFGNVTDLEMGPDGNVYVVGIGAGAVYRIRAATPQNFFTVPSCRLVDTRSPNNPLANGVARPLDLTGPPCGIPDNARAVSLNVTVIQATGGGLLTLFPGNLPAPLSSTLNFNAGQTRANNAQVSLSTNGDGTVRALATVAGGGTVHIVIDVNGYFL